MTEKVNDILTYGKTCLITCPDQLKGEVVAASIGMFDGVHRGHAWLIGSLRKLASAKGMKSAVITFRDHPQNVLRPESKLRLIMPLEERIKLLASTGIDYIIMMDFTSELSKLDSTAFLRLVSEHYGGGAMLMGFNHRFGHNRNEQFADYVRNGEKCGVAIERADEYCGEASPVSSSIIRQLLDEGDVESAGDKLGRNFSLVGKVVHGFAKGREIGFPTANVDVPEGLMVPKGGVYAVNVRFANGDVYGGMANIGVRPTFSHNGRRSIEVNIFDFSGEIYGDVIYVDFVKYMREERPMESAEALARQLEIDQTEARRIIENASHRR